MKALSGLAAVPVASLGALATRSAGEGQLSLLDALNESEAADALTGSNRIDITAKLRSLIARAPSGSVIDATMLRGTVRLTGDIFDGVSSAPVTLRTGSVTFRKDFNAGPLRLPSHFHWQAQGTQIRPSVPLRTIPSDNAVAFALVETCVNAGRCSGIRGQRTVEADSLANATALNPGARIAVFGLRLDRDVQHRIDRALTARTRSFGFTESVAMTIENSLVYLLVDGEILLGAVAGGTYDTGSHGARGALGTVASPHPSGATATLLRSEIFAVTGVSGTTVTLDRPLPRTFVNAPFRAGSVGTRISGQFIVDGEFERRNPTSLFQCLATTLSTGFRAEGLTLRRGMHGGVIGYGCRTMSLDVDEISGCGRPAEDLGGSIWLFGSAERNRIRARRVTDGYAGFFIDNKSSGVTFYGLDGPCLDNSIEIETLDGHEVEGQITGSSGNTVLIHHADTSGQASIIDHGISQATARVATAGNVVTILNQRTRRAATGDALGQNRVVVAGEVQR